MVVVSVMCWGGLWRVTWPRVACHGCAHDSHDMAHAPCHRHNHTGDISNWGLISQPDHVYFRHTVKMFSDWFDICRGSMLLVCLVEQNAFFQYFATIVKKLNGKIGDLFVFVCRYLVDVWGTHKRFPRVRDLHISRGHVASCAATWRHECLICDLCEARWSHSSVSIDISVWQFWYRYWLTRLAAKLLTNKRLG